MTSKFQGNAIGPIDREMLSLRRQGGQWVLYYKDNPIKSPGGNLIARDSARLLNHVRREVEIAGKLDIGDLSAYSMFCTELDFVAAGNDMLLRDFHHSLLHDPILYRQAGPEQVDQMSTWGPLLEFLNSQGLELPVLVGHTGCHGEPMDPDQFGLFAEEIKRHYLELENHERTAIINLFQAHEGGVLFPLILVLGRCTPLEYAEAILATTPMHTRIFGGEWDHYVEGLSTYREHATIVMEYLSHYRELKISELLSIINSGEGKEIEFKETLRFHIHKATFSKDIEYACLKTVAAFLNTKGGVLLVGVADNGDIAGLEKDGFPNSDNFQLHFMNIVKASLGESVAAHLDTSIECFSPGKEVFVVKIKSSKKPVYLKIKGKEDAFYVRTGPGSHKLPVGEIFDYCNTRFS